MSLLIVVVALMCAQRGIAQATNFGPMFLEEVICFTTVIFRSLLVV